MTTHYVLTLMVNPAQAKLSAAEISVAQDAIRQQGWEPQPAQWLAREEACDIHFIVPVGTMGNTKWLSPLCEALKYTDAVAQPANEHRRKRLLISDMDSTIITVECIDELADMVGLKPQVAEITERAMNGELDFKMALAERVTLLRGLGMEALEKVYKERIRFMPGAAQLLATMRAHGAHCLLVSGGFTYFTAQVRDALGFHEDRANVLEMEEGKLTGRVILPILDKDAKLDTLHETCKKLDLPFSHTLAIGDGANDLPMLLGAGLGIAYHAKPTVQAQAKACFNHVDLHGALYAQGYRSEEIARP